MNNLDYTGGNPNSQEAFFSKDVSGLENEDVIVGDFIWNRGKSNENIIDTGDGKGFSFYYARHVFSDNDNIDVYNEQNPDNFKTLGIIDKNVMVVINCETENERIRIISAWEVDNNNPLAVRYFRKKNMKKDKKHFQENIEEKREKSKFISQMTETEKREVWERVTKKIQERQFEKIYENSN